MPEQKFKTQSNAAEKANAVYLPHRQTRRRYESDRRRELKAISNRLASWMVRPMRGDGAHLLQHLVQL